MFRPNQAPGVAGGYTSWTQRTAPSNTTNAVCTNFVKGGKRDATCWAEVIAHTTRRRARPASTDGARLQDAGPCSSSCRTQGQLKCEEREKKIKQCKGWQPEALAVLAVHTCSSDLPGIFPLVVESMSRSSSSVDISVGISVGISRRNTPRPARVVHHKPKYKREYDDNEYIEYKYKRTINRREMHEEHKHHTAPNVDAERT